METNIQTNKALAGTFILATGVALLLNKLNLLFLPTWILTWPMLLVVYGIYKTIKNKFKNATGLIFILIGGVFLYGKIEPTFIASQFIWPMVFISMGLALLFNSTKKQSNWKMKCEKYYYKKSQA